MRGGILNPLAVLPGRFVSPIESRLYSGSHTGHLIKRVGKLHEEGESSAIIASVCLLSSGDDQSEGRDRVGVRDQEQ